MKVLKKILYIIALICFFNCGDSNSSKPNIKDNALRKEEEKKDYSQISPDVLHKHVLAHFNLEEYQEGKAKLSSLMLNHPELIDSLGLNKLKVNFDEKLEELQKKAEALAAAERRKKLPKEILEKMTLSEDNGLKTYKDNTSPKFDTAECFYIYCTKDDKGKVNLFLKIRYVSASEWLNIENVIVTVDNLDHNIEGEFIKEETRGKKKQKMETLIVQINSPTKMKTVKSIANGTDVVGLYVSDVSYKKREFTTLQKEAFANVLDTYLYMGGNGFE